MDGRENSEGPPASAAVPEEQHYFVEEDYQPADLSALVVEAIAAATDIDPTAVEIPLSRALDPDALNELFDAHEDGEPRNGGQVTFRLWGLTITVHSHGHVVVYPPDDDPIVTPDH